jgi:hypothetical protein
MLYIFFLAQKTSINSKVLGESKEGIWNLIGLDFIYQKMNN